MKTAVSLNRAMHKEFISGILFIGIYICSYYIPLFAEYMDKKSNSGFRTDNVSTSDKTLAEEDWIVIKSNYFTIYCDQEVNLKTIERRLGRRGLFLNGAYGSVPASTPDEKIAYRMDTLLKRVREILGMHTKIPQIKIKIFKDRNRLSKEYFKIFNTQADFKAFYIYKYDTIYTSEEDLSDSVMAHEMGHAVVDYYFSVVPPEKIREILASYVDLHLEEE